MESPRIRGKLEGGGAGLQGGGIQVHAPDLVLHTDWFKELQFEDQVGGVDKMLRRPEGGTPDPPAQ
jgi:hypothetical protein